MSDALTGLPWVDPDSVEINSQKQVRLTLKNPAQFDEKKLVDALSTRFQNVKVLEKPKK